MSLNETKTLSLSKGEGRVRVAYANAAEDTGAIKFLFLRMQGQSTQLGRGGQEKPHNHFEES
ncbi:MAG: hypothetical protein ACOCYU_07945 [Brevefilum sp.]